VKRLFARTQPDNPKAGRVAEAAGMTRAGELDTGTEVWIRDRADASLRASARGV